MRFRFADDDLAKLYSDVDFDGGHGRDVVRAFRKVMQAIDRAVDERDFYAMKSLHLRS